MGRIHTNDLLLVVATDDHVADHGVGNTKHAIELRDGSRVCMEVDEGVVTFGELVDLVSELALAPLVDVVDLPLPSAIVLSMRFITARRVSGSRLGSTKNSSS